MAVHWVNYDLHKPGQDYEGLIAYLKSHTSWAIHPLHSAASGRELKRTGCHQSEKRAIRRTTLISRD